jgi:flagellar biosynthesis protein FlhG
MISITSQFLNIKVEYLGFVYEDTAVSHAVLRQRPFMVEAPRSKAAQCVQHIVGRLEKTVSHKGGGFSNLFKRLFGS